MGTPFAQDIGDSLQNALDQIASVGIKVVLFVIILLIGWFIARIIRNLGPSSKVRQSTLPGPGTFPGPGTSPGPGTESRITGLVGTAGLADHQLGLEDHLPVLVRVRIVRLVDEQLGGGPAEPLPRLPYR